MGEMLQPELGICLADPTNYLEENVKLLLDDYRNNYIGKALTVDNLNKYVIPVLQDLTYKHRPKKRKIYHQSLVRYALKALEAFGDDPEEEERVLKTIYTSFSQWKNPKKDIIPVNRPLVWALRHFKTKVVNGKLEDLDYLTWSADLEEACKRLPSIHVRALADDCKKVLPQDIIRISKAIRALAKARGITCIASCSKLYEVAQAMSEKTYSRSKEEFYTDVIDFSKRDSKKGAEKSFASVHRLETFEPLLKLWYKYPAVFVTIAIGEDPDVVNYIEGIGQLSAEISTQEYVIDMFAALLKNKLK